MNIPETMPSPGPPRRSPPQSCRPPNYFFTYLPSAKIFITTPTAHSDGASATAATFLMNCETLGLPSAAPEGAGGPVWSEGRDGREVLCLAKG